MDTSDIKQSDINVNGISWVLNTLFYLCVLKPASLGAILISCGRLCWRAICTFTTLQWMTKWKKERGREYEAGLQVSVEASPLLCHDCKLFLLICKAVQIIWVPMATAPLLCTNVMINRAFDNNGRHRCSNINAVRKTVCDCRGIHTQTYTHTHSPAVDHSLNARGVWPCATTC